LLRASTPKTRSDDPVTSTDGQLIPYLDNVLNKTQGVAIFTYVMDDGSLSGSVINIRKVDINLIVQSSQKDLKTNQFHTITVTGQAVRFNPNQ
jgi:hypothetical protein